MFLRRCPQLLSRKGLGGAAKSNLSIRTFVSEESTKVIEERAPWVEKKMVPHDLFYVKDIDHIKQGVIPDKKTIQAYELSNNKSLKVKIMREGGNMVQINFKDRNYVWDNVEGATHYGANENAFPKTSGLILHGGIRFAAVTAEHGLYYESQWNVEERRTNDGKSHSIILSIQDTEEERKKLNDKLSTGPFNSLPKEHPDSGKTLNRYPVSNLWFKYEIKLNADEEFVRLKMTVENPTDKGQRAEAWLPMTYPIDDTSQIISNQKYRWKRDDWCFPEQASIVKFKDNEKLNHPLQWSSGGIYYDWPTMDGYYHAVNNREGRGVAYVVNKDSKHFMKLWSWGDRRAFDAKKNKAVLEKGRPLAEYYEPWGSAFNHAFFQTTEFPPKSSQSWEACIVPIEGGLTDSCNNTLQRKVETAILEKGAFISERTTFYD